MRAGCWAAGLGDCGGKLSAEHVMSAALWAGPVIKASGGPYGRAPRDIGVANLTAKVLCQRHNSRLSEVDTAGVRAFETLTHTIALANARRLLPAQPWMRHGLSVDGPRLERWFLKTAINVGLVLKKTPVWAYDGATGSPSPEIVEMAFGLRPISAPMGLYASARVGDDIISNEEIVCEILYNTSSAIGGASFRFRGFGFVLNLRNEPVTGIARQETPHQPERTASDLLYRLHRINSDVAGYRSHFVDFNWPGRVFNHFAP